MAKNKFIEMISDETGKLSTMRILSLLMFFVAAYYLYYSFFYLMKNVKDITMWTVILHIGQNALNFAFAFFPKVLQKKLEQVNVDSLKKDK